jgi:hypothetical protein
MGAEIQDGAVLVARAILNSSVWTMRAEDKVVAITCICLANWKPRSWFNGIQTMLIGRGQFVRSWQNLAMECGLTIKTVRTSVKNLEIVGFLARKRAGHVQVFTLPKYDHYQDLTKYSDSIAVEAGKETGSARADSGQDAGSKLATNNKGIREEGKKEDTSPSSPMGMLLAKAEKQAIPGKLDTKVSYFKAWTARTDYTRTEQMIMDPWSRGKTVIELQDHFFPKGNDGMTDKQFAERRDGAYRKV